MTTEPIYAAKVGALAALIARQGGTGLTVRVLRPKGWYWNPQKPATLELAGLGAIQAVGASDAWVVVHFDLAFLQKADPLAVIESPDLKTLPDVKK